MFDEFINCSIDQISRIVHRADRTQDGAKGDSSSLFAIGNDLVVLTHQLVMPVQRPIMVVSRNHVCGKIERLAKMSHQRRRDLVE